MALKVKFSQTNKPLTIKSSAAATTLESLADFDTSTPEAGQSGTTLVYDATTETYKAEKVFDYDGDEVTLKGGSF